MRLFFRFRVTGGVIAALHAALAPPLVELAPKVTERAFARFPLSVRTARGHLSQGERQG